MFDVLYFEMRQQYININSLSDKMFNLYREFCEQLKFKIYKSPKTGLDWLLPMLMNGQVSVGDVEEELGMVAEGNVEYKKNIH